MSSVTWMALFPPAFASSASDPLLLETDLEEVEADPLAALPALAAGRWAPSDLAAHRLGAMLAVAGVEETALFACDARAERLREVPNLFSNCCASDHAMALEWRWAQHPGQSVGVG